MEASKLFTGEIKFKDCTIFDIITSIFINI